MKRDILLEYIKKYWFKASIICFMLFVLFKKDITFGINFNSPNRPPQQQELQRTSPQSTQHKEEREYFTEKNTSKEEKKSLMDRFTNFPSFGGGKIKSGYDADAVNEYLTKYVNTARVESQEFGIPASIILASALIHSEVGNASLMQQGQNYFALPCTADWKGEVIWQDNTCYRKYEQASISFRDHSLFFTTGVHAKLRELNRTDYKAWAKAIDKTGYSNQRKLAKQLIKLIEEYDLQQLDVK